MAVGSPHGLELGAVTHQSSTRKQSAGVWRWVGLAVAAVAMVAVIAVISGSDSRGQVGAPPPLGGREGTLAWRRGWRHRGRGWTLVADAGGVPTGRLAAGHSSPACRLR